MLPQLLAPQPRFLLIGQLLQHRRAFGALDRRPRVKRASHESPARLLRKHVLQDARIIFSDIVFLIVVNAGLGERALAQSGDVARVRESVAITQGMPLY